MRGRREDSPGRSTHRLSRPDFDVHFEWLEAIRDFSLDRLLNRLTDEEKADVLRHDAFDRDQLVEIIPHGTELLPRRGARRDHRPWAIDLIETDVPPSRTASTDLLDQPSPDQFVVVSIPDRRLERVENVERELGDGLGAAKAFLHHRRSPLHVETNMRPRRGPAAIDVLRVVVEDVNGTMLLGAMALGLNQQTEKPQRVAAHVLGFVDEQGTAPWNDGRVSLMEEILRRDRVIVEIEVLPRCGTPDLLQQVAE